MPFTKPVILPEFALLDAGNGLLGANNVQTPDTYHKEYGWDYGEAPPREFFNWLHRLQYQWTAWHDQEMDTLKSNAVALADINKSKYISDADNYFRSQR